MTETVVQALPKPAGGRPSATKTAVVVVHGMGEQRPMETLWGLVEALWIHDPGIDARRAEVWSKPEEFTGSYELRRITTSGATLEGGRDKRADFFEFYWAHLMTGNTVTGVTSWLAGLLLRRPATVPSRLLVPWIVGLLAYSTVAFALLLVALEKAKVGLPWPLNEVWITGGAALIAAAFAAFSTRWLAPVAGDAARYLSATPDNVAARQKIREAGIDLLQRLHSSGRYDRIVVIGHSLGSIIAFDVLNFAWGRIASDTLQAVHAANSPAMTALAALEASAGALVHAPRATLDSSRQAYREAQRVYQAALIGAGSPPPWLVTDFVTVGSPLSKADVLLAAAREDLERKKRYREVPCCPPWLEVNNPQARDYRLSYPAGRKGRIPHHGAVFAPVVWTNIYFPSFAIIIGDLISGACAPLLGRGILDVRLKVGGIVFRHLDYWRDPTGDPPPDWIVALRKAVNLRLLPEHDLWARIKAPPSVPAEKPLRSGRSPAA